MKDAPDKIIIRKCCNNIQNEKKRQKSFQRHHPTLKEMQQPRDVRCYLCIFGKNEKNTS